MTRGYAANTTLPTPPTPLLNTPTSQTSSAGPGPFFAQASPSNPWQRGYSYPLSDVPVPFSSTPNAWQNSYMNPSPPSQPLPSPPTTNRPLATSGNRALNRGVSAQNPRLARSTPASPITRNASLNPPSSPALSRASTARSNSNTPRRSTQTLPQTSPNRASNGNAQAQTRKLVRGSSTSSPRGQWSSLPASTTPSSITARRPTGHNTYPSPARQPLRLQKPQAARRR
jgi:hypothetical protein